jgi:hypothetical protein
MLVQVNVWAGFRNNLMRYHVLMSCRGGRCILQLIFGDDGSIGLRVRRGTRIIPLASPLWRPVTDVTGYPVIDVTRAVISIYVYNGAVRHIRHS